MFKNSEMEMERQKKHGSELDNVAAVVSKVQQLKVGNHSTPIYLSNDQQEKENNVKSTINQGENSPPGRNFNNFH